MYLTKICAFFFCGGGNHTTNAVLSLNLNKSKSHKGHLSHRHNLNTRARMLKIKIITKIQCIVNVVTQLGNNNDSKSC